MTTDFRKKLNSWLWPLNTHVSWLVSSILSCLLPIATKVKSSLTGVQSPLDKVHKSLERFMHKSEHRSVRLHNRKQVAFPVQLLLSVKHCGKNCLCGSESGWSYCYPVWSWTLGPKTSWCSLLGSRNDWLAPLLLDSERILRPHPDLAQEMLSLTNGTQGCRRMERQRAHLTFLGCAQMMGSLVHLEYIFWYLTVY